MNRTEDQILSIVRQEIVSMFRCNAGEIDSDTTAADVNGWDSLSHTHFLMRVEKTFGIRFDPYTVGGIGSVGELVGEISRLSK